ncbi:MAG: PD-(D/E)XK nuclease family protein [Pirellulales bacterium]
MPANATILLGPAGAGKTTRLLACYRDHVARRPSRASAGSTDGQPPGIGSGLWIAPTHRSVEVIRGRLLDIGLQGCLAPNCLTFAQFAKLIVHRSPAPARPLRPLEKRQFIRRLIEQAVAGERLGYFRPIAHTEGLIDLVSELFSDLKRQEIWPDEFKSICNKLGNAPKDCALADLYERYQLLLNEHQLYDDEGLFWSARDLLGQGHIAPFDGVSLVVVDGFADFTRTQHEIVSLLYGRVDQMLISLLWEDGRADLFHKPAKTLTELERRLPALRRETISRPAPHAAPSFAATLGHLEQQLFRDPRHARASDSAAGLEILAASGQLGEVELLARTIKRLLVEGDIEDGKCIRPGDVAVVFRSTADVAPLVREAFTEYGIPFALDSGIKLARAPLLLALIAVLRLDLEDWPFRQLLELVSNNYFQPEWPQWRRGAAAVQAEVAIRALQIPKGRRALLAALARWAAAELDERAADRRRQRQIAARGALDLFTRLATAFDRLPSSATAGQWSTALQALADELGLLSVAGEPCELPVARQDAAAWELFRKRLEASLELEVQLDGAPAQLDRRAILQRIEDICATEELPPEHDEAGRVRVLAAASARALDVPYLFVAGLSERVFPAAGRDDRLYTAAEHRQMNRAGLRFVERHERACEEMLLFYEMIMRARRRLWLSYSALDEAAQPLSPSPYVTEVERLFRAGALHRVEAPNLSPVPTETEPYCVRDFRVKAISMAIEGSARLAGRLLRHEHERDSTTALLAALRATGERSRRESFGAFEGVLASPAVQARLAARFGPEHCWSTSQLEQYGRCPHQFFLQRVLGLNEIEDISLEINHFLRGRRAHTLLAEVHRQLNALGPPCSPTEFDAEKFQRLVAETLTAVIERSASEGLLESAFDCVDHRLIERWIKRYLDQHLKYDEAFKDLDGRPMPTHFEVSFGPVKDDENADDVDPLSKPLAYELTCNGVSIRLSGRVDRIDIGLVDGQVVFNVLDYKTTPSAYFRAKDISDCKSLQLPLYAMAVQDLLLADKNAVPWHGGYWHLSDTGFNAKRGMAFHERTPNGIRRTELWTQLRERLVQRVTRLVMGIQQGQFPMHCEDEHCTGRCQYKTVCRVHAVRSLEKTWQPPSIPTR